jgi:hypothetical protein
LLIRYWPFFAVILRWVDGDLEACFSCFIPPA